MMRKLNTYKENYLLWSAVLGFSTFAITYFILSRSNSFYENPTRLDGFTNFKIFVLSALFFAPIVEEIIFRGYFTKNKILKFISIVGLPAFTLSINKYYLILSIPYAVILILIFLKKRNINIRIAFFANALLFSLIHYKLHDFTNFITIIPIVAHFSIGLFLIWIVVNFNLKVSIISHFILNFIIILPLSISLQFPDNKNYSKEIDGYKISWKKTAVFNKHTTISRPNNYEVNAKKVTPIELYKVYASVDNNRIKDSELFSKYNINIISINNSQKKLDSLLIKKLLLKTNLLTEIKSNY